MSDDEKIPPTYTEQEAWLVDNLITGVKTSYKMTSEDTADDYITLSNFDGKTVTWKIETFRKIARMTTGHISNKTSIVEPVERGLADRINERRKWVRKNSKELAEFKRLQKKFGTGTVDEG